MKNKVLNIKKQSFTRINNYRFKNLYFINKIHSAENMIQRKLSYDALNKH